LSHYDEVNRGLFLWFFKGYEGKERHGRAGQARVDYAYVTQRDLSKNNVHRVLLSGYI